jgi:uncharacterized protein
MSTATAPASTREAQFRAISFGDFVDLELRDEGDGRTFFGIAVPWEVETDLDGYEHEVWTKGSFNHQLRAANRVSAGFGHIPLGGSLIGGMRTLRDDAKGLYVEGHISDVPDGNNAITLMKDKALRELSIGFFRVPGGDQTMRRADYGILRRYTKANLFEVALTPMGQYGQKAAVSGMRQQQMAGRERIEVSGGYRTVAIHVDGVEVAAYKIPALGQVEAVVEPPTELPAPVDPGLAELDAMLAELPDITL